MVENDYMIGTRVYWMAGKKKISGFIIDIYEQNAATINMAAQFASGGQFLLIQTNEGKVVTRAETAVEFE